MFKLSNDHIQRLHSYVDQYQHEICGTISLEDNNMILSDITNGTDTKNDTEQAICNIPIDPSKNIIAIFHSHSNHMRAYPSIEDIESFSKTPPRIRFSMIATKWGIWIIRKQDKIFSSKNIDDISECINRIGLSCESSWWSNDRSIDLSDKVMNTIYVEITEIEGYSGMKIVLLPWNVIKTRPIIIYDE